MIIVDKPKVDSPAYTAQENKKAYTSGVSAKSQGYGGTVASAYTRTYTSYSGNDMICIFELPLVSGKSITKVVGEMQTISYSLYNQKMPVRVLGDMNYKSYVFSNRMVAGKMIFTVFDRHWAQSMMDEYLNAVSNKSHVLIDEIPPINVTISMSNEYGSSSRLAIYGVSFVSEGQVMSVQDMYTENTFEFFAKDVDYLSNVTDGNRAGVNRPLSINDIPVNNNVNDNTPVDNPVKKDSGEVKSSDDDYNLSITGISKEYDSSNPYVSDFPLDVRELQDSTREDFNKKLSDKKAWFDNENEKDYKSGLIQKDRYEHRKEKIRAAYNYAFSKTREYYDEREREKKE